MRNYSRVAGVSRKGDTPGSKGPTGGQGPPKLRVSKEELARLTAMAAQKKDEDARASGPDQEESSNSTQAPQSRSGQVDTNQLVAIFSGALGLGSFLLLPLRYALLTLGVALLAVGLRTKKMKRAFLLGMAVCAFAATLLVWLGAGGDREAGLGSEQAKARTRLEIVDHINDLRSQRHVKRLFYSPSLSLVAQQRADFGAAAHSGFATESTAGTLPSTETNVWVEMAGVACSWERLFEIGDRNAPRGPNPELGFIEDGIHVGEQKDPYLSEDLHSVGVGVEPLPDGNISVVLDFVGPPKAGEPWLQGMPNLLGEVVGVGVPDCS